MKTNPDLKKRILKRFKETESACGGELTKAEKVILNIAIDESLKMIEPLQTKDEKLDLIYDSHKDKKKWLESTNGYYTEIEKAGFILGWDKCKSFFLKRIGKMKRDKDLYADTLTEAANKLLDSLEGDKKGAMRAIMGMKLLLNRK